MTLTITMNCDNAAFADNPSEVEDVLKRMLRHHPPMLRTEYLPREGTLRDSNGNSCGTFTVQS